MSSTKEQDVVPYQNEPLTSSSAGVAGARLAAGDARRGQVSHATLLGYLGPNGNPLALTGDEEAPFVKVIYDVPALFPVSDIPSDPENLGTGVKVLSTVAASLHDFVVSDSRADRSVDLWVQLFDSEKAPTAGDVPSYCPISLCKTVSWEFDVAPWGFTRGIVIALSSTANTYTAIAPSNDYAITARIQPRSI